MPAFSKPSYKTVFNGFVGELPAIKNFLKYTFGRLGKPVGHRYLDKLIIYDGVSFRQRYINMSFRDMVSGIDVSEIESLLHRYSVDSGYINNVQLQLLNEDVNLKLTGDYQVIAITNQINGGYFDLQAFVQGQFLTYENTCVSNMKHSNDIHCSNHLLVHHIDLKTGTNGEVLFGAVGFRKKLLHTFDEQSPVVVIVDHEDRIGYVVPCPLDRMTLGNATLSMFLKGTLHEQEGEKYCNFSCLQTPIVQENVDTGELPESLMEKITNTNVQVVHDEPDDDEIIPDESNDLPAIESQSSNGLYHFYAGNHTGFSEKMRLVNIFPGITSEENPFIPSVFEYLLGLQGMHGLPFQYDGEIITFNDIRKGKFLFEMNNSIPLYHEVMKSFKKMGNGLFIIHLTDEEMSNLSSLKMKILDIVGPRAYVVLENQGLYFYYRGISIPGFTPMMLGEQIPDFEARLQEWIDSPQLWDSISLKIDNRAYIPDIGFVYAQEFLNNKYNLSDLISIDESKIRILEDVLTQFSICCDVKTLEKIISRVLDVIEQCQKKDTETCETQMTQIMHSESLDIEAIRELQEKKQPWQRLLQLVKRTVSLQGVISQKTTVEREKRRLQMMSNVSEALVMRLEDFFEKLESSCITDGIVIASLEPGAFVKILEEITKYNTEHKGETIVSSKFGFNLSKILERNMLKPNPRCPKLDADVFSACADAMMKQGSDYEFSNVPGSLVLRGICHGPMTLPLPMFEQLCGLSNPYVLWKELANDSMISAWRIKFRSTLTKLRGFDIKSDCTCLGASISLMLLVLIENYVSSKTSIPDEDSSELRVVRGLLGLLFTIAASGMNSQIKFWEIFSDGPFTYIPDTMEELDLYKRVLTISSYAGWVSEYTLQRFQKLVGQVLAGENCKDLIA